MRRLLSALLLLIAASPVRAEPIGIAASLLPHLLPALTGTVVDAAGRPLPGAEVKVSRRDEADAAAARKDTHLARTSGTGVFRVAGLSPGASYDVLATQPGHAPAVTAVSLPRTRPPAGLVLVLCRGRMARGAVVDSRGRPVAEARVELVRSRLGRTTSANEPPLVEDGLYRSSTGAGGRFDLGPLPPG